MGDLGASSPGLEELAAPALTEEEAAVAAVDDGARLDVLGPVLPST